ncbi:spindle pole body protein, putative, partial [Plasmodium ovale curtisi]
FNKNDPASDITRSRPERVHNNSIDKDLSNQKNFNTNNKTDKNNYQKKFINELLRDKAYISMIHNTIKHYDKHFKNFFLLLTEYVNNNIDDYAHNFLIKLDYNFYYTNKYKQSFQTNSSNYHAQNNVEWTPNQSQDHHQSKNYLSQNQDPLSINTTNNEYAGKINSSDYPYGNNAHLHRPHKDTNISEHPEHARNYNNYTNNNNIAWPVIPDISPSSNHMPMHTSNDNMSPMMHHSANNYNENHLKYEINRNNFANINPEATKKEGKNVVAGINHNIINETIKDTNLIDINYKKYNRRNLHLKKNKLINWKRVKAYRECDKTQDCIKKCETDICTDNYLTISKNENTKDYNVEDNLIPLSTSSLNELEKKTSTISEVGMDPSQKCAENKEGEEEEKEKEETNLINSKLNDKYIKNEDEEVNNVDSSNIENDMNDNTEIIDGKDLKVESESADKRESVVNDENEKQ